MIIRDGVSSSQISSVVSVDIPRIKEGLKENNFDIKLTKIIVNRKSKNKFFMVGKGSGEYLNPNPGTLISNTVTNQDTKEFYLISQKTNQGTAAPIHYQCLCDDSNSDSNDLYLFIYKLCYLYFNWSGSIKVPAPVHYAKKLAFMVGDHLSTAGVCVPNEKLSTGIKSLFYI